MEPEQFFKCCCVDILNLYVAMVRTSFGHSTTQHRLKDWTSSHEHELVSTNKCDIALW